MPPFPPALVGFALWRYAASHYDGRICPNALVRRAPARRQTLQRTQVALGPHYRVARMPPQSERQTPGRVPTVHDAEEVGGSSPPAPTITKPAPVLAICSSGLLATVREYQIVEGWWREDWKGPGLNPGPVRVLESS